jgi:hypothetical protein
MLYGLMDVKTRKLLLDSLLATQCAFDKSTAMLEQTVCLSIPKPTGSI